MQKKFSYKINIFICSGPDDNNQVVSSVLSDEHPTIYSLTKGFQLHQWSLGVGLIDIVMYRKCASSVGYILLHLTDKDGLLPVV